MADNDKNLFCPACHSKMTKVPVGFAGVNIDICIDGCGGIYFDTKELEKVVNPSKDINGLLKIFEGKHYTPVNEDAIRVCPLCGARMVKNSTESIKDIQIDECYNCGGKFLDHGELEKIRHQKIKNIEEQYDYNKPADVANDWLIDFVRSLND